MQQEKELDEANRRRQRAIAGDAVAADGTILMVARRQGTQRPNTGDMSTVSRAAYAGSLRGTVDGNHCPIVGCIKPPPNVRADKQCRGKSCSNKVHHVCAIQQNLLDEDNELNVFCSLRCKANSK